MVPRLCPSVDWTVSVSDAGGVGVRLGEQSAFCKQGGLSRERVTLLVRCTYWGAWRTGTRKGSLGFFPQQNAQLPNAHVAVSANLVLCY